MRKMCNELIAREKTATRPATWMLYQGKGEGVKCKKQTNLHKMPLNVYVFALAISELCRFTQGAMSELGSQMGVTNPLQQIQKHTTSVALYSFRAHTFP